VEFASLGFEVDYEVSASETQEPGVVHHYGQDRRTPSSGQLSWDPLCGVVAVQISGPGFAHWTGKFEAGPGGISGLFGTPAPKTLCVIADGRGYWVPTAQPSRVAIVRSIPIKTVFPVHSRALLLFVDSTRLTAYGPDGFLWQTHDLSWDGLRVTAISAAQVEGVAWDAPRTEHVPFVVDLGTGESRGGSSPERY
jgi:hypothetical protein